MCCHSLTEYPSNQLVWAGLRLCLHHAQVLEAELQAQESQYQRVLSRGQDLLSRPYEADQHVVHKWMRTLRKQWSQLTEQALARRNKLHAATAIKQVDGLLHIHNPSAVSLIIPCSLQYFVDVAEANSWLSDRKPPLLSDDRGKDESSTAALLQRHQRLEKEMAAFAAEIRRLWEQARSAAQLTALTVSVDAP